MWKLLLLDISPMPSHVWQWSSAVKSCLCCFPSGPVLQSSLADNLSLTPVDDLKLDASSGKLSLVVSSLSVLKVMTIF